MSGRLYPYNVLLENIKRLEQEALNEQIASDSILFLDAVGTAQLFIVEGHSDGPTKFRGKFQESGNPNKNKREYPHDVLSQNIERLAETIKARGLVGELDHPTDSIIHFEKASHVITDLWWEGNVLMGEGEILPTPHGLILEALIKSGVRVGVSSRGVGNGKVRPQDGVLVIGESYKLITFDAVADPSTFSAYQKIVTNPIRRETITNSEVMIDLPADVVNSPVKNEMTGINSNNDEAFVAYIGQLIRRHIDKIKQEI